MKYPSKYIIFESSEKKIIIYTNGFKSVYNPDGSPKGILYAAEHNSHPKKWESIFNTSDHEELDKAFNKLTQLFIEKWNELPVTIDEDFFKNLQHGR